jgi:hypothetical protein
VTLRQPSRLLADCRNRAARSHSDTPSSLSQPAQSAEGKRTIPSLATIPNNSQ